MDSTKSVSSSTSNAGDAAVGGLFQGLLAGLVMAGYLLIASLLQGIGPGELWSRFAGPPSSPWTGVLTHLAVSAIYGVIWGLLWRLLHRMLPRVPAWVAGPVYGLVLLLIAQAAISTLYPLMMDIGVVHRTVAHLIYGLVLGFLTARGVRIES